MQRCATSNFDNYQFKTSSTGELLKKLLHTRLLFMRSLRFPREIRISKHADVGTGQAAASGAFWQCSMESERNNGGIARGCNHLSLFYSRQLLTSPYTRTIIFQTLHVGEGSTKNQQQVSDGKGRSEQDLHIPVRFEKLFLVESTFQELTINVGRKDKIVILFQSRQRLKNVKASVRIRLQIKSHPRSIKSPRSLRVRAKPVRVGS